LAEISRSDDAQQSAAGQGKRHKGLAARREGG